MKAFRLPLAIFLALSLFLSPAASLAQAPTQVIIQTLPPTVDGIVDAEYGPAVAIDPAGDSQGGNPVDLINLWVTQDETHFFFAYEVNTDISTYNWGKYVIYLDTTGDANGATNDAWGRPVTVADPHKPEYGIYTWVDNPVYDAGLTQLVHWTGTSWDWGSVSTVDAAAIGSGTTSIIEYSVSKAKLGNPDKLWVEVWSTGGGSGDNAQDTINFPSNDWQAPAGDWSSLATLLVSTPILSVDGEIEALYNAPIATDSAGDGNGNAVMDLLDLYVTEDASQYYFAYTINADIATTNWGKYALYIDTSNDANGAASDAWGRNVVVNDPHKPEFGIYTWVDATPYGPANTNFVAWTGTEWDWVNASSVNEAALTGGAPSVIEWSVEKNRLGNPDTLWLEVWDTGGGSGDNAQDTINDPANDWNATDWSTQSILSNSTQYPLPVEPPIASQDNNVWWDQLGHNSRDTLYRTPGGPVTTGTEVILRLRAAQGDLTEAKLRLYNDRTNVQSILPMTIAYSDGTYDWWEAAVPVSTDPTVYWYRFIAIDGTDTDYYEDDDARTMGWGQAFDESEDFSYQLTVYDADFATPEWIKNAIIYQVFPDRFRDGDPSNNKPAGSFFYGEPDGTISRSNTTDWNTYICDPRATGDPCEGSYSKNFYGGDLAGLTDKLDYLEALGVNTIYLNPIFESPSNHGYDTTDYMSINEMFGDPAEFFSLVTALKSRGMHLILDGVFNHVSSDSIYFDRYSQYGEVGACEAEDSPYRSWFYFTDPEVPGTGACVGDDGTPGGADYESWWGYDSLPKLNSANPEVKALMWDYDIEPMDTVAGYWMNFADGWRLDVGADVDPGTINDPNNDYWEGFRNTVKTVNADGYITGEEWGIANSWLLGGEWDAVMNYQFSSAVLSLWRDSTFTDNDHNTSSAAGALTPLSMEQFDERILNLQERYAPEAFYAMMNLFGSHDTNRALFMLDENTDDLAPADYLNPDYDWSPAIEKLKGAALVQMTMPGAPTIYYGDEVGLVGPVAKDGSGWQDDPYNRQPYPWLDESGTLPFYTHLQSQAEQDEIYDYYATLTSARNTHPALRTGDYRTLLINDTLKLYAYGRNLPDVDSAVVLINRNTDPQNADIDVLGYLPVGTTYQDVLSTASYTINSEGKLQAVSVPANGGTVLVRTNDQAAPPANILDLEATTDGVTVNLSWTAVANVDQYLVYRSYLAGGTYELRGMTSTTSYSDHNQISGQKVYYIVIAVNNTTGLTSTSNEVSALPAYTIGWANLQYPLSTTHIIGITPTENIYGQVYIAGVTDIPGATPGLLAQVGYGPNGSLPSDNPEWVWYDTEFNGQTEDNDEEFKGTLLPEAVGDYDYAYRYSTTAGESWVYADLDGTGNGYSIEQAGSLTVVASTDTTPPSAPTLSVADWSASSISLSWTEPVVGEVLYAYDIYRSTDNDNFSKIDRVFDPELSYLDEDVVTNETYYYYVIALDTSFNFSSQSNVVSHTAEAKMVAVTFNVTVPEWTPGTVYLTRVVNPDGTIGGWDAGAEALTKSTDTLWTGTFNILDETVMEFKFARGTWETVIKGADGNEELANLPITVTYGADGTQLYEYTVLNWSDPIVISTTPADGETDVLLDASITVAWSQEMPNTLCPNVWVEPNPADLIPVTCSFDMDTNEMTITPTDSLPSSSTIGVGLTGLADVAGDIQQVSYPLSFTTFNNAPVANNDTYATAEDTQLVVDGVLDNDNDADGDTLTAAVVDDPLHGTLNLADDGSFTYLPSANFNEEDSFTYKVFDGDLYSAAATVTITVTPVNDPPVLDPIGDKSVEELVKLTFTAIASDVDLPQQTLSFSLVGAPTGALIDAESGVFTWTPTEEQAPGGYTFDVCVSDDIDQVCETITVTVTVAPDPMPFKIYLPLILR